MSRAFSPLPFRVVFYSLFELLLFEIREILISKIKKLLKLDTNIKDHNKLENEIVLHHATFRTPELDHIIPYVLGGDSSNNWQILCKSCNIGKSDYINYMYAFSSQSTHRLSDLESLTYGKRYAVIASTSQKLDSSSIQISDGRYYRIFKNNDDGFLDSMNLKSEYC